MDPVTIVSIIERSIYCADMPTQLYNIAISLPISMPDPVEGRRQQSHEKEHYRTRQRWDATKSRADLCTSKEFDTVQYENSRRMANDYTTQHGRTCKTRPQGLPE